jgi:ornithine carbamoyltransferase
MYDAIEYRGSSQESVELLAAYAGVPVWNGLTDQWHPTQSLCDMLTMREHTHKPDREIAFAFLRRRPQQRRQLITHRRRDDGDGRAHGRTHEPAQHP